MKVHRLLFSLVGLGLVWVLSGCQSAQQTPQPFPPTPATQALLVSGASNTGDRLRITLRSLNLLKRKATDSAQLLVIAVDTEGHYTYLVYPANQAGDSEDQFDLSAFPLELTVDDTTTETALWMLAIHNSEYRAAERLGLDSLAARLAGHFSDWLADGDSQDDPLAAAVSASDGVLYEWFASIDVLGQGVARFPYQDAWRVGLYSLRSPDEGLNAVYTVQYVSAGDTLPDPPTETPVYTPVPTEEKLLGYALRVDETFENGTSIYDWYEGQDSTYTNHLVDGAYEIKLTDIKDRTHGVSWGSLEGQQFHNYVIEAQIRLVESGVTAGRYGIWFNYQDDYNFIYFGISNQGQYRVAIIKENSRRIEIQDWTSHPAVHPGAATNTLTIETSPNGAFALSINGQQVTTFNDQTFDGGSVAFFCYAESVPATCRLEGLRIWEPAE